MERDHLFDSGIPFCHSASVADSVRLCPGGVRLGSVRCFCRPLRRDFSADRPAAEWNLRCEESPAVRSISRGDPRFRLLSGSGGGDASADSPGPRGRLDIESGEFPAGTLEASVRRPVRFRSVASGSDVRVYSGAGRPGGVRGDVAALLCSAPRGYDESSFPPAAKSRRKRTRRQRKCPQKTIALIRNRSHSAFNPIIKIPCIGDKRLSE